MIEELPCMEMLSCCRYASSVNGILLVPYNVLPKVMSRRSKFLSSKKVDAPILVIKFPDTSSVCKFLRPTKVVLPKLLKSFPERSRVRSEPRSRNLEEMNP